MQITEKFEIVPVAGIKPDEHNARKHSDEQITELRRSLREFGSVNPLLIAVVAKINFLAGVVEITQPVLLYALTGVVLGRGPSFVHDLRWKIKQVVA